MLVLSGVIVIAIGRVNWEIGSGISFALHMGVRHSESTLILTCRDVGS